MLLEPSFAVIAAVLEAGTAFVVIMKWPVCWPGATETVAGTDTIVALELSFTAMAPLLVLGIAFKSNEPALGDPPVTVAGSMVTPVTSNGTTERFPNVVTIPALAVSLTTWAVVTALCVIVNVAVSEPAGTVTVAGTFASAGLALVRVTTMPPVGAGPFSITDPVTTVFDPPTTRSGAEPIPSSDGA